MTYEIRNDERRVTEFRCECGAHLFFFKEGGVMNCSATCTSCKRVHAVSISNEDGVMDVLSETGEVRNAIKDRTWWTLYAPKP